MRAGEDRGADRGDVLRDRRGGRAPPRPPGGIGNVAFAGLDLFVHSDEAMGGPKAFAEKRVPDFSPYR